MSEKQAHIRLSKEDAARYAILPGDPGRIDHIKKFLDEPRELVFNREMRSASGFYKGVKVLAVSTGMGELLPALLWKNSVILEWNT